MHPLIVDLLANALGGRAASPDAVRGVVPLLETELLDLMAAARTAASCGGARPFTCGIVNAKSGLCGENCAFCAQSAHFSADVKTYPLLDADAVLARAEALARDGVDYMGIVVSGGSPDEKDFAAIREMAETIRRRVDIKLCASLGIIDAAKARALRSAGFASYHHNLETARSFYPDVCTSHAYEVREQTVRAARAAGLRVCCGGIFGLGETWRQRIELAETLADLDVDSIPVNFLTPIPGTPLGGRAGPTPGEALATLALFRLMHPKRDLVVCGGRERSLGEFMPLLFGAGANGVMVGDYLTTKGSAVDRDREIMRTLGL